jgi:hypothetical protein
MKKAISYFVIVSSVNNENIQTVIPKSWIINKESGNPLVRNIYEWYWPTEHGTKKVDKKFGQKNLSYSVNENIQMGRRKTKCNC